MKLLLDTHLLLWTVLADEHLSVEARALLEDLENELFFSAASIWEIAIKRGLGRADFQIESRVLRRTLIDNGFAQGEAEGIAAGG